MNRNKNTYLQNFPAVRLRRLRQSQSLRRMLGESLPGPEKYIWPVFVIEGNKKKIEIESMPGQYRYSIDSLLYDLEFVVNMGIAGIMVFGVPDNKHKSVNAEYSFASNGIVQNAIKIIRKEFPQILIFTDVCVCAYTTHGHCGIVDGNGQPDNDLTNELLAKMAVSHAQAGAHGVAPSAMMDGQVATIRKALDENGFFNTLILSYSTKFASAMYGPFRDAAGSAPEKGDRKTYQLPFNNISQAIRESELDEAEGADILMVKPALFYLDVIAEIRRNTHLPLAVYNVSGEYSMLIASARNNWGNLRAMVRESVSAIRRAGADIIISYWANQYDKLLTPE